GGGECLRVVVASVGDDASGGSDPPRRRHRGRGGLYVDHHPTGGRTPLRAGGEGGGRDSGRGLRTGHQGTDHRDNPHDSPPRMCCARYVGSPNRSIRSSWVSSQSIDCSPSASIGSKIKRVPSSPTSRHKAIASTSASTVVFSSATSFSNWSVTPEPTRIRLSRCRLGVPSK